MTRLDAAAISLARQSSARPGYPAHGSARREAFAWYSGKPPSPGVAARHFAAQAERDPLNRDLYAEALQIFLATCWNLHSRRR